MAYRQTRNQEASIIDALKVNFAADWSSVNVEMTFARVYEISLPTLCVRLGNVSHSSVEIGTESTKRSSQLLIDIFADNDGQLRDLVDYTVDKIKSGFVKSRILSFNGTGATAFSLLTLLS